MTDKIIKIKAHLNINLTVNVTDQMVKDYKECYKMATSSDYEDFKNCDSCSWWKMKLDCIGMCTLDEMKVLLEQEV